MANVPLRMRFYFLVPPRWILTVQISFLQSYQDTLIVNNETGKFPVNVVSDKEKIMLHLCDLPKEGKG